MSIAARVTPILITCSVVVMARLSAQTPSSVEWTLSGARGGYCIWYLADSATVRQFVPKRVTLTSAADGATLTPFLARTVQDEPRFASWIPGSICLHFYSQISRDGKTLAAARAGHVLVMATNAVAARDADGVAGATSYLVNFMTDDGSLQRAAQDVGVDMDKVSVATRVGSEGGDSDVVIELAGVVINWTGHPSGEPSVGTTHSMSFGYAGARTVKWLLRLDQAPAASRLMVGSLQINGKNALATALKASPVRDIGPEESGGSATLTFQSAPKH